MIQRNTWVKRQVEDNADTNTVKGGTDEAEEGGRDITGVLMVATPTLNKGATIVDRGASTALTEATGALTSVA